VHVGRREGGEGTYLGVLSNLHTVSALQADELAITVVEFGNDMAVHGWLAVSVARQPELVFRDKCIADVGKDREKVVLDGAYRQNRGRESWPDDSRSHRR